MPQPVDVRTPVATGETKKIGKGLYRKQVLPVGEYQVGGRKLHFTPDYHRAVASAFAEQAYDTVPTMLADRTNDHTMALLDEGGEVLALEAADDGLYATVQLSEPVAERVERNPRLGVSVRIRENYDRSDGKFFPAAMQHLLLTWDPRIAGMHPWEPIDLSNPADDVLVIDLSAATYDDPSTTPTSEGEPTMADLTSEELAQVRAALPLMQRLQEIDVSPPAEVEPTDDELDAEYARLAADIFGDLDADEDTETATGPGGGDGDQDDDDQDDDGDQGDQGDRPRPQDTEQTADQAQQVAASNSGGGDYLEMANSAREEDRARILELSNQLDAATYEKERDQLVRVTGLPPSIIELARPVLEGSRNVVELSNGSSVDAGEVMRKVLAAVGEKVQLLDLSAAIGTDEPTDEDQAAAERRRSIAADILANY